MLEPPIVCHQCKDTCVPTEVGAAASTSCSARYLTLFPLNTLTGEKYTIGLVFM